LNKTKSKKNRKRGPGLDKKGDKRAPRRYWGRRLLNSENNWQNPQPLHLGKEGRKSRGLARPAGPKLQLRDGRGNPGDKKRKVQGRGYMKKKKKQAQPKHTKKTRDKKTQNPASPYSNRRDPGGGGGTVQGHRKAKTTNLIPRVKKKKKTHRRKGDAKEEKKTKPRRVPTVLPKKGRNSQGTSSEMKGPCPSDGPKHGNLPVR